MVAQTEQTEQVAWKQALAVTRAAERNCGYDAREKLMVLGGRCRMEQILGWRPFQTYSTLLDFRDSIAHARTEVLSHYGPIRWPRLWDEFPHTTWQALCTPQEARALFDDAEVIVRTLASYLEPGRDPFFSMSSGLFRFMPG